uniref:Uncharacterized protein n=1 Tax=Aegilops tauschii subsp. strangulata TaxID=200361 RepID=A0A453FY94_AEGTS
RRSPRRPLCSSTYAHQGGDSGPARCPPTASSSTAPAGWNGSLHPVESQDSMSATEVEIDKGGKAQQDGDAARYEVCSEATSGWTRRLVRNPL